MNKVILIFLMILITTSCEKSINVSIPLTQSKLFINSLTQTGNIFEANLGKTVSVLAPRDSNNYKVNDALVQLYVNNIITDTLIYNSISKNYIAKNNTTSLPGNTYLLKATASGYNIAEAETATPAAILIQQITRRVKARKDPTGEDMDEIKITFQDDEDEANYYLFSIKLPTYANDTSITYYGFPCFSSGDADIERSNINDPTTIDNCIYSEFFMTDKNFNGRLKEISLFMLSRYLEPFLNTANNKMYKAIVELNSITYNHYKYRKSRDSYINNNDNPFSEPVLIYSNVKNGYGIFSSFNLARDTIR